MENRIENPDGIEIPKKKRSLDLKSLYKSRDLKEGNDDKKNSNKLLKRKLSSDGGGNGESKKKKKKRSDSRKEVYVSSFENGDKKSSKSLDEVYSGGLSSGSGDLKKTHFGLNQSLGNSSSNSSGLRQKLNGISLSLDDNVIQIPKRRRDFVRRKKFDGDNSKLADLSIKKDGVVHQVDKLLDDSGTRVVCSSYVESGSQNTSPKVERKKFDGDRDLKPACPSSAKDGVVDQVGKLSGDSLLVVDSSSHFESLKVKRKKGLIDLKENKLTGSNGVIAGKKLKVEDAVSVLYNSDSSSRKPRKNRRKRNKLSANNQSITKEAETAFDVVRILQEDDEENLEQNAARMLSSRFDPKCTGFSSDKKASPFLVSNGLSLSASSGQDFVGSQTSSMAGLKSASVDAAGRVLRPRKHHKRKGLSRKRRHFYEIMPRDLDAYWVLNRRIKVFWPLDKSWYYGLVTDYDSTKELHHVKYDDRDEEWINLENERFKLLLLPSEVSGKTGMKISVEGDRHTEREKGDMASEDDNKIGSYKESEPIISWLARSTRRVKSSPFVALKKQKTLSQSPDIALPVLFGKIVNAHSCLGTGHSKRVENKSSDAQSPAGFDDAGEEKSVSENASLPQDVKQPIVYFRRRFRQKSQECCRMSDNIHACRSVPDYVTSLTPLDVKNGIADGYYIPLEQSDQSWPLWCLDNSGLLKLFFPVMESRQFRFVLSFPAIPVLHYSFAAVSSWLCHTLVLSQYGMVMTTWPVVHLEILFVDNIVGLRFFLFEGCLKQAVAIIFLVLTVFNQQTEHGKYNDVQMPVTSVRVRLSCIEDLKKQLVFSFYNFSEVESLKWLSLDFKLKRHCSFTKNLPLSDCTYDNIKALQSGYNPLHLTSICEEPSSTEVLQKRFRKGTINTGASRESACVNMTQSSSRYKERRGGLPAFSLSFAVAPTFFLDLHLKLLMERSVTRISFPDHDSVIVLDQTKNSGTLMVVDDSAVEDCFNKGPVVTRGNSLSLMDTSSRRHSCVDPLVGDDGFAGCSDVDLRKLSHKSQNGDLNIGETSSCSQDPESDQLVLRPLVCSDFSSPGRIGSVLHSHFNGISVEIPHSNQVDNHVHRGTPGSHRSNNLDWHVNDGVIRSANPTGPRTMWNRNRNSSSSSSFGPLSHVWPDGKDKFYLNGFASGPKKPRTQVSYTVPVGDSDLNSKHRSQQQKGIAPKRIRRASDKRTMDRSKSSQRNVELLSCDANVLITLGDRGWRESGAMIVVELVDRNEWRLVVKLAGTTKYSYKARQFLQPGSTNRYTHAMMWRGGKDWILEFPDRSQWQLFKEMHEECYNRNIHAASVKNIPIPGVHLIEEADDNGTEVAFVRSCPKYIRQVESDVDMALDPSRVIYDMDSDDEQWILKIQISDTNESGGGGISNELFEKTMDMFEKVAYTQERDQFTFEEIEEFLFGVGPVDVIKIIYEHWQQKRQRKGMPLIRQLQPPLWERYHQQVKEWELAMTKTNSAFSNGCQEKNAMIEKPPMAAFCLKPRGLEVPNKGSKQRPHRKFPVSGQINTILGDHDVYHPFGRRINGFAFGDEKVISPSHRHGLSEASPSNHTLTRAYSPRDVGSTGYFSTSSDGFERNHHPKLHRTKSKKIGTFLSNDLQQVASFNQRTIGNRNGVQRWNMGLPEWPSQKNPQSEGHQRPGIEHLDGSVLDEFRLRDASGAARHALNMSKLKREKAQRFLYRADLAIHKAVVALMTAEAIKASSEDDSNDDG